MAWTFLSFIKKGNKPLENCWSFFSWVQSLYIQMSWEFLYCVCCELFFLGHLTPKANFKGNKMIQQRFVKGLTEKRENWRNSAGSFPVYSFNYLHFPLAVLRFRFLSWEYSDMNFRSFWHYKLSHFHAIPLTNPYKCSVVILNYSFVVIKVELVHNTISDSEKEGWVGRLRL